MSLWHRFRNFLNWGKETTGTSNWMPATSREGMLTWLGSSLCPWANSNLRLICEPIAANNPGIWGNNYGLWRGHLSDTVSTTSWSKFKDPSECCSTFSLLLTLKTRKFIEKSRQIQGTWNSVEQGNILLGQYKQNLYSETDHISSGLSKKQPRFLKKEACFWNIK